MGILHGVEHMRKPLSVHQDTIMDEFDFEKVHKVMEFLGWEWFGAESGVPTTGEMRRCVRDLMFRAYEYATKSGRDHYITTGGFCVSYDNGGDAFEVSFKLAEWNTYDLGDS